jgi:hypothetical protein
VGARREGGDVSGVMGQDRDRVGGRGSVREEEAGLRRKRLG